MCLLVVLHCTHPDAPLVVAANRDEVLARPAVATTVLRERDPRVLGGRDLVANGTWLAVNERGVFAGLTNRPTLVRDGALRSRGELPLALVEHASARDAVAAFARRFRPAHYGPAWLLVGDREALFFVDMTSGDAPDVRELAPGVHVLENRAFLVPSGKVARIRALLDGVNDARGEALVPFLHGVLRDHTIPEGDDHSGVEGFLRPRETEAACVHAGPYGTRSASVVVVPAAVDAAPRVWSSEGPPCTTPLEERTSLWHG